MTIQQREIEIETMMKDIAVLGFKKLVLTPHETAQIIGISVSTLYNWRVEGVGPQFRKNGNGKRAKIMYPTRAVAEFMTETQLTA